MKILYTVSTYNPHTDGIQFVTSYLAEGLASKGHSIDLIAYEYPELTDKKEEVINGVHIIRYPAKTIHMRHKGDKESYLKFIVENQDRYDAIINVGSQTAFTDWLLPIMDQIHIPKVLHLHSIWDFKIHKHDFDSVRSIASKILGNCRWGLYFLRNKKAFRQYDAVLQLHEKDYACKFFKRRYNIDSVILENAVEAPFFKDDGAKKEKIIINVSNYCKRKNQLQCVKAFEKSNLPNDWKLILVGSKANDYYKQLNDYCKKQLDPAKRDRVALYVGIPRERVVELVKSSSIYMMTSLWEAFPISLLEGMAAKTPYISSNVGIVKYLNGGVIACSDEEFIEHLQKYTQDDAAREQLGQQAYEEALRHYRIEDKVDQLEKVLLRLCEHKKSEG